MQPLIKWPGGKSSEYEIIKQFIPKHERYVEPFLGGGAVFFNMQPQPSLINDISANLMQFYRFVQLRNEKFEKCLYAIEEEWERLKSYAADEVLVLLPLFMHHRQDNDVREELEKEIEFCCNRITEKLVAESNVYIKPDSLRRELCRTIKDKFFRTRKNEVEKNYCLSDEDIKNNLLTGFTSGYYMYLRDILNRIEKNEEIFLSEEYKIAVFYFVREFCYGAMFRYNRAGDFNIPYGGIAYNNKDFKKKIDLIFSEETQKYFIKTEICCCDFEKVLDKCKKNDFVFLDPPYDTDFSDYENHSFREADQRRLAERLKNIPANFLLIINNTPLINELYQNSSYRIYSFDNQYSYCVKGRNDRKAVHLIITNYDKDRIS